MSKRKLIIAALLTAIALVAAPNMPAQAGSVATTVFVGKATLTQPICFPALCPKNLLPIGWTFAAGPNFPNTNGTPSLCAGVSASLPTKAGKSLQAGTCDIQAAGTLTGLIPGTVGPWCGQSVGTGAGTLKYNKVKIYGIAVNWDSAGSILILTGTASKGGQTGPFAAVIQAAGDRVNKAATGSCLPGGATSFLVIGVGAGTGLGTK